MAREAFPTTILAGDVRTRLAVISDGTVQCAVTSPPYYGLRCYGIPGQLGLEDSPDEYVDSLVAVFREVRRVLRPDGTLWLNVGDSYASSGGSGLQGATGQRADRRLTASLACRKGRGDAKTKDLLGTPWLLAFALRADGWFLRSEIVWHKSNASPESVRDRPACAHEKVFLLSKSPRYHFDGDATAETATWNRATKPTRHLRNVWTLPAQPLGSAHIAVMPPALAERCVLAGSRPGDLVLDPFLGSGTTALVANRTGRDAVGVELNPAYVDLSRSRLAAVGYEALVVDQAWAEEIRMAA